MKINYKIYFTYRWLEQDDLFHRIFFKFQQIKRFLQTLHDVIIYRFMVISILHTHIILSNWIQDYSGKFLFGSKILI